MKKIIIGLAFICIASVSQGAMFKWAGTNIYAHDGVNKFTGSISLYLVDAVGGDKLVSTGTVTAGLISAGTISDDPFTAGQKYSFYVLIEDGEYTGKFTPNLTEYPAPPTGSTTIAFGNLTAKSQSAENWTKTGGEGVPEPTSTLLVMMGLAALSLRRKQK